MTKLNLGCGDKIMEGYINIDKVQGKGVLVYDLNKIPYPFKNDSIDEVYASHILEHLDLPVNLFLNELKRILKDKGIVIVRVPIGFNSLSMFHTRFFNVCDFNWNVSDSEQRKFWQGWIIESKRLGFHKTGKTWFLNRFIEKFVNFLRLDIYEKSFLKSLFPADEIIVKIRKGIISKRILVKKLERIKK